MIAFTKPRKTLAACCAIHGVHDGLSNIMFILLPVVQSSFSLSFAEVGMVRGAHRAAMALFQLPAGMLSERLGERNLLVLGTAVAGLAAIGLGLSAGFVSLLAFMFLVGMGSASQHPLSSTLISVAYAEGRRRAALGTYNFAGDVGKFAIAGGLSLMLAAGMDWRGPVVSLGVFTVLSAVVMLVMLRTLQAGSRPEPVRAAGAARRKLGWGIREPVGFGALTGIFVVDNATRNGFLTFVAFLLIAGGVDEGVASMAVPAILIGGMWGKLACGFLAERIGIIRTVILTEIGTAAGIVGMIFAEGAAAFVLLPFLGVALNGTTSVLYGTIGDLVESERQSRAFGLFYTVGAFCGIIAPLGFGVLSDVIGIPATMVVIAVFVFATIPLCLVLAPVVRATPKPAE